MTSHYQQTMITISAHNQHTILTLLGAANDHEAPFHSIITQSAQHTIITL
jgi:hypothetical protein